MNKITTDNRASGFDATDWLQQSWAYQAHDVGTTPGYSGDMNRRWSHQGARPDSGAAARCSIRCNAPTWHRTLSQMRRSSRFPGLGTSLPPA
jgi:hypothetical protein